jgi:hypothetical protein
MESTLTKYSMWWRKMYFLIVLQKMLWFNGKPKINESYIDKNTYIVEKYLNLFVRALETGRKSILCWAFLPCFEARANELYIFRQCTYIVFIMQCKKSPRRLGTSLLTNGKAKSTFTRRRLRPNSPPTWACYNFHTLHAIIFIYLFWMAWQKILKHFHFTCQM